jgi:hypothetical protein
MKQPALSGGLAVNIGSHNSLAALYMTANNVVTPLSIFNLFDLFTVYSSVCCRSIKFINWYLIHLLNERVSTSRLGGVLC